MTPDRRRIVVAGIAYFSICLWVASFFATWSDEEYSLATSSHGVLYAFHRAIDYELQAPLYFMLLAAWRQLDSAIWFARLLSIVFATGLFFTLIRIGQRIAPRRDPVPFALIASINPFVVLAALEIRLYAMALFLSGLLWLCFDSGFANGNSRRARVSFVAVAIAAVYTQYFLGFMLLGFGVALAVSGRLKILVTYACYVLGIGITTIPLLMVVGAQAGGMAATTASSHFSIVYQTALHPWLEFVIPHFFRWGAGTRYEHVIYICIGVLMALCAAWFSPNLTRRVGAYIAIAVVVELLYVALALGVDQRLSDRYFIALYVPVAAAVYAYIRCGLANPPVPQRTFTTVLTIMTVGALISQYRFLAQNGDWIRVARYVEDRAKPGDVVAVYTSDNLPAFLREYRGPVRVVPFPRANPQDRYVLSALGVHSAREAATAFAGLRPFDRLWLIDVVRCDEKPPPYGCDNVEDAVSSEFTVLSKQQFYTNQVLELRSNGGGPPGAK